MIHHRVHRGHGELPAEFEFRNLPALLFFFAPEGFIDGEQAFGKQHFDTLAFDVHFAQPGLSERDEELFFTGGGLKHEERCACDVAVDADDGPEVACSATADIDDVAADEVVDVDGVLFEGRTLRTRDGDIESAKGFSVGDRIDPREFENNASFVQPVLFEYDRTRGHFIVGVKQDEIVAFCETLGKVGEDLGKQLAIASLRAHKMSDENPLFWVRHREIPGRGLAGKWRSRKCRLIDRERATRLIFSGK